MPNRMAVIIMIQACPPPRPDCFDTDQAWKDWLIEAHVSKLRVVRRDDRGKWTGERHAPYRLLPTDRIPYCADCTEAHRARMMVAGRCHPSQATAQEQDDEAPRPMLRMVMA